MLYLISYDLHRPAQNYGDLISELKRLGATKVLLSQWLLASSSGSLDLVNHLRSHGRLDGNDRLLITEITTNSAWYNLLISHETMHGLLRGVRV